MVKASIPQLLDVVALSAFKRGSASDAAKVHKAMAPLKSMSDEQAAAVFGVLSEHRLHCLFWDGLKQAGATDSIPASLAEALKVSFNRELVRRATFELGFLRATKALHAAGLGAIACKGIVLAQHYYPARGLRRMQDLDLWLSQPDGARCITVLDKVGFELVEEKSNASSLNFISADEVVLDVHLGMNLFQDRGYSLDELSVSPYSAEYRVFIPEAMLAHLLTHLLGHSVRHGILLCWFIDIALVLRKTSIDPARLKALLRPDGSWSVFLRLLRTYLQLGWVDNALGLEAELAQVREVPWERIVRQRRRAAWTGLRGKLRLGRSMYQQSEDRAPYPRLMDWLWEPLDWFAEATSVAGAGGFLVRRGR